MVKLTMEYWQDEGWFVGRLIEVPGVFSQGETLDELKENIQDAYKLMLDSEPANFITAPRHRLTLDLTTGIGVNLSESGSERDAFGADAVQSMTYTGILRQVERRQYPDTKR